MKKALSILLLLALLLTTAGPAKLAFAEDEAPDATSEDVLATYAYNGWYSFDENNALLKTGRDAVGEKGVVSSQRYEASQIGIDIMKKGGNAVDAAVATAFALGVCEPNANGLGGGGFMTLRNGETGEVFFIDFREVAPGAATEDMYPIDENGNTTDTTKIYGGKAIAVPGEVKGLLYILEKYGTMSRQEVMQPAIDLATNGYLVTPKLASNIANAYKNMIDYSEAFKITYAERAAYMGDPRYVDVPMKGLMSKDYAKVLAAKIDPEKAQYYEADDPWKYEGNSTSHLSVADAEGNMVAITHTINYYFGSGVVADGYGFILNNEMDDFSPVPGGPNSVAPGKKPLSSMSPTIVLNEDGTPFMVLGCPGGMTIFTQVAQVISHVIDHGMPIQEAINQPRIWDAFNYGVTYMDGVDEAEAAKLEAMGHTTSHMIGDSFGFIQAVQYGTDGKLYGGADPYTDCKAVEY